MSTANFHAKRLGLIKTHTYGCSCGCNSCGPGSEYAGGALQFEDYNENNKLYRTCAEYNKAVEDFKEFRRKVINKYGKRPRGDVWLGFEGKTDKNAKDKHLRSERKANLRLKALQQAAEDVKFKCGQAVKKAEKGEETVTTSEFDAALAPPGETPVAAPPVQVSTDTTQQQAAGGSNTMLFVGIGAVVLIGGAAFMLKKGKKKKKVVAAAPVSAAPVAGAKA